MWCVKFFFVNYQRIKLHLAISFPLLNLPCFATFRGGDLSKDPDVLKAVTEQTKQWTEMMGRHRKEEWAMLSAHIQTQEDIFKKIFSTVEAKQMKEMDAFFAK